LWLGSRRVALLLGSRSDTRSRPTRRSPRAKRPTIRRWFSLATRCLAPLASSAKTAEVI